MERTHQCSSKPDGEPQNVPDFESKQPMQSNLADILATEREELAKVHQSDVNTEHDAIEENFFIPPQILPCIDATTFKQDEVCMPQNQPGSNSNYNNPSMEPFNSHKPKNTLDTKLAELFPSQYPGYIQKVENPFKFVTPLVQGAMQSAVDCSKSLLQTRNVMEQIKKLPVAQPLCTQPSSIDQMPWSSTVTALESIRSQVAVPKNPPRAFGVPRVTTKWLYPRTQGEQSHLAKSATASATTFSNAPTKVSTLVKAMRQSEVFAPCFQPRSVHHARSQSTRSGTGAVPGPSSAIDEPQTRPNTQCTVTSTDSQPRNVHNALDLSLNIKYTINSGNPELSNSRASISPVNEKVPDTKTASELHQVEDTHVPDFQPGRVNAKKFRPRYYDLSSLEIGTWKHQRKRPGDLSRLKIIFTQGKFVYEFQLNTSDDSDKDNQPSTSASNNKQIACIDVPFSTVVGINISQTLPAKVVIEVDTAPAMWEGTQTMQPRSHGVMATRNQYNTLCPVDLTDGQLLKVPYHKLTITSTAIITHLMRFDPRFSALLRIPIKTDTSKLLTEPSLAYWLLTPKKRKRPGTDEETTAVSEKLCLESDSKLPRWSSNKCSCTAGCTTRRCYCVRSGDKCQQCRCAAPCKNPMNILEEFGVNLAEAKNDSCLVQTLPKVYDLRTLLRERTVLTPCCGKRIPLKNCCVGVVECPECESEYRYSWCFGDLCDEENRPRNHCEICERCRDYRDRHCSRCNKCYFAGSYDFPCPCSNSNQDCYKLKIS